MRFFQIVMIITLYVGCSPTGNFRKAKSADSGADGVEGSATGLTAGDGIDGSDGTDGSTGGDGVECTPGIKNCVGNSKTMCQLNGAWSEPTPCPAGMVCSGGVCGGCVEEQLLCQGKDLIKCKTGGQYDVVKTCANDEFCYGEVCVPCIPGTKECRNENNVWTTWQCSQSGDSVLWTKTATCPEDCKQGLCISPCQSDIKLNTNQGCDYYAIDLQNSDSVGPQGTTAPQNAQFAIIVTNPSPDKQMTVTVHETQKSVAIVEKQLQPKALEVIPLGPRNILGTVKGNLAWRIKGDRPFVAYQFNPLDNVNPVFSNDASLLLPVNALGKEYLVMSGRGGGSFVTIIGTKSNTEVTVTVTHDTEVGPELPAMKKGDSVTKTLGAGEVLNIKASQVEGIVDDLTGTQVKASKNVAVFGGNVATTTGTRCCADHLEQQLFPVSSWGTTFVATKAKPRWAENDHWRILASEDNTKVSFSGGISNPIVLMRGQFHDLATTSDFVITSDKPVMVGQFLASSGEILPPGVYCDTNNDCASGVCSGAGSGLGQCMDTCQSAQSNCASGEACIANSLFGDSTQKPGASCVSKACGPGLPPCGVGSMCATYPDGTQRCLAACTGFGCANNNHECINTPQYGSICQFKPCTSDFNCPGGWCNIPPGQPQGGCFKSCNLQNTCPNPGQVCLPEGLASEPNQNKGICLPAGCDNDGECKSGYACVPVDGQAKGSCQPIGDPAFILAVPAQQFRKEYKFLAPNAYKEDYVNVIAPTTAFVQLDGADLTPQQFTTIPGTEYMVARVVLSDGAHYLSATEPVGVVVYGYHDDVSYGYPGGANLFDLGN